MDRVLFQLGPLNIYTFGVTIAVGTLVAYWLINWNALRTGQDQDKLSTLFLILLGAGILGARIFFILFYDPFYYWQNPGEILKINEGGLSIHGGILGAILAGFWYCKRVQLPFWQTADRMAPAAVLGQGIARLGCDVYGKVMTQAWSWGVMLNNQLVHPVQIYETLLDLTLFIFLWGKGSRQKYYGQIFVYYLGGYALIRLFLEFFRINPTLIGNLTPAHLTSLLFILMALVLDRWLRKRNAVNINTGIDASPWASTATWFSVIALALVSILIFYAGVGGDA